MAQGVIKKSDLKELIAAVGADGSFLGPVPTSDGVALAELGPGDEVALDYANFTLPIKRQMFPYCEVISTGGDGEAGAPLPDRKAVIFGVRPCDAQSLDFLDKVFCDEEFVDPYYRSRRDNYLIISLACSEPAETCFCTSVSGGPAGAKGADILAFDVGDSLLLESVTNRGEAFMKTHAGLFSKPTAKQIDGRKSQAASAEKKVPPVAVDGVTDKLPGNYDSPIWQEITQRCLGCGVCTYLCPTCHCFGLYDQKVDSADGRVRAQDSCMFASFTLEASGHNPRASRPERMRQRIMHKFRYTVEKFGDVFCVGCGRCVTGCPVNVDIRETLTEAVK